MPTRIDPRTEERIMLKRDLRPLPVLVLVAAALAVVSGCGGGDADVASDPGVFVAEELRGAPDWVIRAQGDDPDKIYGLGSATGSRDTGLMRDTALARARNDIVLQIQAQVRSLLESYQSTTTGGAQYGEAANDEQHIENMVAQVGQMDLSGAGMETMWISATGTMWVLASIDVNEFTGKVNAMSQLSERVREDVVERAREGMGRLWDRTEN
jgi:hypothetical protein